MGHGARGVGGAGAGRGAKGTVGATGAAVVEEVLLVREAVRVRVRVRVRGAVLGAVLVRQAGRTEVGWRVARQARLDRHAVAAPQERQQHGGAIAGVDLESARGIARRLIAGGGLHV